MRSDTFRDRVLGAFSSHPYWRVRRSVWLRWLAAAPLFGVLVLFVVTASDIFHWAATVANLSLWIMLVAGACALGIGFLTTLVLIDRWAYLQGHESRFGQWSRRFSALDRFPLDPWILAGALVLGLMGPWLLRRFDVLPSYLHLLPELAAFLPLLALLLALRYLEAHRKPLRWRSIWSLLIVLVGALLLLTVVYDLARAWQASTARDYLYNLVGWYADIERPFLSAVVLVLFLFALIWVWRFWTAVAPPGEETEKQDAQSAGLWSRFKDHVKELFGKRRRVQGGSTRLPDWLLSLVESLRADPRWPEAGLPELAREPEVFADEAGGRLATESGYRAYFVGRTPTRAQDLFLRRFNAAYESSLGSPTGLGDGEPVSADLLIEGELGTGRTSALIAAAAVATGVRGQRALYLTASSPQTGLVVRRVNEVFTHLGVESFFSCEPVTGTNLGRWLDGAIPVPNVLVATPSEVEQYLYGAAVEGEQAARLRTLLLALEVLLVDDFTSHAPDQAPHLPFIVDKQVLLLASRHIPAQVVVAMPPLAAMARHLVSGRLFRHVTPDQNLFTFEPPPAPAGFRVTLWSDDPQGTFESLKHWLETVGKSPVVLRSQAEIGATNARSDSVIILAGAADGDAGRASLLQHGSEGAVVITVLPRGEPPQQKPTGIVPVIVDRSARPIMLTHFRSVTRFLEPRVPIPLVYWKQFGLSPNTRTGSLPAVPAGEPLKMEARFRIDAVPDRLRANIGADIWPYLLLEETSIYHRVELGRLPDPRRRLYQAAQGSELVLGISEQVTDPDGRRAVWSFNDGEWESDLACLRPLSVDRGGVSFVPDYMEQDPQTKRVGIVPKRALDSGRSFCLPWVDVGWEIGRHVMAKSTLGGAGFGYALFDLDGEPMPRTRVVWQGLLDELGRVAPISPPVSCDVVSSLSGILLLPRPMAPETIASGLPQVLAGNWETGRGEGTLAQGGYRFWPALTAAFNYAARRGLPGAGALAQTLAFGLNGEAARTARAVVWVIEPEDTGSTVSKVLRPLLEDDAQRKVFFESMLWLLMQLNERRNSGDGAGVNFMRHFSRVGYDGDSDLEPLDQPLALCQALVARASPESYMEEVLAEEPTPSSVP